MEKIQSTDPKQMAEGFRRMADDLEAGKMQAVYVMVSSTRGDGVLLWHPEGKPGNLDKLMRSAVQNVQKENVGAKVQDFLDNPDAKLFLGEEG